jgi:PP-loop superfamily ATP-utilizing enzyme
MEESNDVGDTHRGLVTAVVKRTRVTMYLDAAVVEAFRTQAATRGSGYQTLINEALRHALHPEAAPVTVESLRRVLREELSKYVSSAHSVEGP